MASAGRRVDNPKEWQKSCLATTINTGPSGVMTMPVSKPRVIYQHQFKKRRVARKRPAAWRKEELSVAQILAWADNYHLRTGRWPKSHSGPVSPTVGETWMAVDQALVKGNRGLPKDLSLARLLAKYRGVRNHLALPPFTEHQILAWADDHHKQFGRWPRHLSGIIAGASGETWNAVEGALRSGARGLPGGSSLAQFLAEHRGVRNNMAMPRLSPKKILAWADTHHARTGQWPIVVSGPIIGAAGETWRGVESALRNGKRGLPGCSSLARFLAKHREVRNYKALPQLSLKLILDWADDHHVRTGKWPNAKSGPVLKSTGDTWGAISATLRVGRRGIPGGSSLARLLDEHRDVPNHLARPRLSLDQILAWADAHYQRTGEWPRAAYGNAVFESPDENWGAINAALQQACRGLPAGFSLVRLLSEHRGMRNVKAQPPLSPEVILAWIDNHLRLTGKWPNADSGPITGIDGETWLRVESALRSGGRGLPGGSSLARLLAEHRGVRNRKALSPLSPEFILAWADAHHARTGKWPNTRTGPIHDAPGEEWMYMEKALSLGRRGLPGGSSLIRFLAEHRGAAQGLHSPRYRKR